MIPPPPRSTLFPYTTLFRSGVGLAQLDGVVRRHLAEGDVAGQRAARRHPLDQLVLDRKSTRLNSSHLGISYAVFCLKKKKHQRTSSATRKNITSPVHVMLIR